MQQQEVSPLLSITEFAARLRVTSACVRRWLLERKIASVKLGRLVRIPATEVDRLICVGMRPLPSVDSIPASVRAEIVKGVANYRKSKLQRSRERTGNSTPKNGAE